MSCVTPRERTGGIHQAEGSYVTEGWVLRRFGGCARIERGSGKSVSWRIGLGYHLSGGEFSTHSVDSLDFRSDILDGC